MTWSSTGWLYTTSHFQYETVRVAYPITGNAPGTTLLPHPLSATTTEAVDVGSGDLSVDTVLDQVTSVGGGVLIDTEFDAMAGCWSKWSGSCSFTSGLFDIGLHPLPDGSVVVTGLDHDFFVCPSTALGSSSNCEEGSDLSYQPQTSTTAKVVSLHSQVSYNFTNDNLSSIVDRNGNTTTINYTSGDPSSITDSEGGTSTVNWNSTAGAIGSVIDPEGKTITYNYSGSNLSSVTVTDASAPRTRLPLRSPTRVGATSWT